MLETGTAIQFTVPLYAAQLIIPAVCAGILLTGFILYLFIYMRTRQNLFLSILLFCVAAFVFTFMELSILIFGNILGNIPLGRQMHRIEQLAGLFFIPIIPLLMGSLPEQGKRVKQLSKALLYAGIVICVLLSAAGFAWPELFISQTVPKWDWQIRATSYTRGAQGILYLVRDFVLAIYIVFMIVVMIFDILKRKNGAILLPILAGLLIAVSGAFFVGEQKGLALYRS